MGNDMNTSQYRFLQQNIETVFLYPMFISSKIYIEEISVVYLLRKNGDV